MLISSKASTQGTKARTRAIVILQVWPIDFMAHMASLRIERGTSEVKQTDEPLQL